jgi:surface polysaccharide O-acyltransferase-like enzyme
MPCLAYAHHRNKIESEKNAMTQTKNNSRIESVDTFRLLAVLFVIIVNIEHPKVPMDIVTWEGLFSRWAIPFFFIISGYFLAMKSERTKSLDVRAIIERLAWIFLIWIIVYFPLEIWNENFDMLKVFNMVTSPMFIFSGSYDHLWLIPSLLFGYLVISIFHRYNVKFLLLIMSIVSLVIALIGGGYQIFKLGFILGFNIPRFWLSIPFLYMGFLIYQKGRPSWWVAALLALFGTALQFFEAQYIYNHFGLPVYKRQFLVGTIISAYGMACLALSGMKFLQHPLLSKWGREYSLGIYLIYPLINYIIFYVMIFIAPVVVANIAWQMLLPLVVLLLSIAALSAMNRYMPAVYNLLLGILIPSQPDQN